MQNENIKTGWRRRIGWALFILAVVLPVFYGIVANADAASMLGGRILGSIGIIGLIAIAATRKRTEGRSYVVLAMGVVGLAWALAGVFNLYGQRQDMQAAVDNLKSAANGAPSAARARTVRIPLPLDSFERSEDANIGLLNDVADAVRSRTHEYQQVLRQMQAVPIEDVLAAGNLVTAKGIAESRAKLATYAQLQHQLTELSVSAKPQVQALIERSGASETMRSRVWSGFNESYPAQIEQMRALEAVRQDTLRTISGLLDVAERNLGRTQVQDGKLLFADGASLTQYQQGMAQLSSQAAREEQITTALQTQSQQGVAKLNAANFMQ